MAPLHSAPAFRIPARDIVSVEHPMVILNVDKGLKTLDSTLPLYELLNPEDYDGALPLYLRPDDPTGIPILSENVPTENIVLKVTVPRRTGRRRKRGTLDSFMTPAELGENQIEFSFPDPLAQVASHSRLDGSTKIRRTLQDNQSKCVIEAVGTIEQTHRYRGLADYHYSTCHAPFLTKVKETVLTGDYPKIKEFTLDDHRGPVPMGEIIPPPTFTDHSIPFNWGYKQNAQISYHVDTKTGKKTLHNSSQPRKLETYYMSSTDPGCPQGPKFDLPADQSDDATLNMIAALKSAFTIRPLWTRRALGNHLGIKIDLPLFKECLQYVCYQFRGGPWRDAVINFGVDPRSDVKYAIYQTLFFKIKDPKDKQDPGMPWRDLRSEYTRRAAQEGGGLETHLFDGKTVYLDGKLWQVCDITDPLCLRILENGKMRDECDIDGDGWYCNGTFAKLKGVVRTKISAIQIGRAGMDDEEFAETMEYPEEVFDKRGVPLPPLPDFRGSKEMQEELMKQNPDLVIPKKRVHVRFGEFKGPQKKGRKRKAETQDEEKDKIVEDEVEEDVTGTINDRTGLVMPDRSTAPKKPRKKYQRKKVAFVAESEEEHTGPEVNELKDEQAGDDTISQQDNETCAGLPIDPRMLEVMNGLRAQQEPVMPQEEDEMMEE